MFGLFRYRALRLAIERRFLKLFRGQVGLLPAWLYRGAGYRVRHTLISAGDLRRGSAPGAAKKF
jgi:hypothetical protein